MLVSKYFLASKNVTFTYFHIVKIIIKLDIKYVCLVKGSVFLIFGAFVLFYMQDIINLPGV